MKEIDWPQWFQSGSLCHITDVFLNAFVKNDSSREDMTVSDCDLRIATKGSV